MKEIGKGERVALAKLAVDHFERSQRPLRIAIDAAIWNFQTQAGQGGKNPALRTLFYRLLKLLALPIHPVFVYDGKNKPLTKRGKTVSRYGTNISNEVSKKLIQQFRFPCHVAPGEAEAECAMLQMKGIVDAVMSQDVDAIMFGSTLTLRDWSAEGSRHNKTPTHVTVLDSPRIKSKSGLDPDGMILVALLSGGDYDEAGVPGFGPGLACEIARAGFGTDLLELVRNQNEEGLQDWRSRLRYELENNESGYFKRKHKSLAIPENFPDRSILGYYMSPAVSAEQNLSNLERKWVDSWEDDIDVQVLRNYVADTFDWHYKAGAWKFVRVLAPVLLSDRLQRGREDCNVHSEEQITEKRRHFDTGGVPELRMTFIPADVVGIDLDAEEDSPEYLDNLALREETECARTDEAGDGPLPASPSKTRKTSPWMPHLPEKTWIPEMIVSLGAPHHVERWHEIQREEQLKPAKFATRKCRKQNQTQAPKLAGGMQPGILLGYLVATKPFRTRAALSVDTCSPSSPEPKANMSARRQRRGPSKPKAKESEAEGLLSSNNSSKEGKSREQLKPLEEILTPDDAISPNHGVHTKNANQALRRVGSWTVEDKQSRASSSKPLGVGKAIEKKSMKISQRQELGTEKLSLEAFPLHDKANSNQTAKSEAREVFSTREAYTPDIIVVPSPPTQREAGSARQNARKGNRQPLEEQENVPQGVTQRKRRAKQKEVAVIETSSPIKSPPREQRHTESFFSPSKATIRRNLLPLEPTSQTDTVYQAVTTTDVSTRAAPPVSVRHVRAIPRPSLPGTWREIDDELSQNSASNPQGTKRLPRVSIFDMTS